MSSFCESYEPRSVRKIPSKSKEAAKILSSLTGLREFSQEIKKQVHAAEYEAKKKCMEECERLAGILDHVFCYDQAMAKMEQMLLDFNNDILDIREDIEILQKQTIEMNHEITAKQVYAKQMNQLKNDINLHETLMGLMRLPETDKEFLSRLQLLANKRQYIKEQSAQGIETSPDLIDHLEDLWKMVNSKIKKYIHETVSKFHKYMSIHKIPYDKLLKCKWQYDFLLFNEKKTAEEIQQNYVTVISKNYLSYFKSYEKKIIKLQCDETLLSDDVMMGKADSTNEMLADPKALLFSMGHRGEILTQPEAAIMVPEAETTNKFPFEVLFRSIHCALIDHTCKEYSFVNEYFMVKDEEALNLYKNIMDKTLTYLQEKLETYISSRCDATSIFLCYQLVQRYRILCRKRCSSALEDHWNVLENVLLSRFESILRSHIQSIKECDITKFKLVPVPHYVATRFADFSAPLIRLGEKYPNEIISKSLTELEEAVESLIQRVAEAFTKSQDRVIFYINNYDAILRTISETTGEHSKDTELFRSRLIPKADEYSDQILFTYFKEIVQFVNENDTYCKEVNIKELTEMAIKAPKIAQIFNKNWKQSLQDLNDEVLLSFAHIGTAYNALKIIFLKLQAYHRSFCKFVNPDVRSQIVDINHITDEMQKYRTSLF